MNWQKEWRSCKYRRWAHKDHGDLYPPQNRPIIWVPNIILDPTKSMPILLQILQKGNAYFDYEYEYVYFNEYNYEYEFEYENEYEYEYKYEYEMTPKHGR